MSTPVLHCRDPLDSRRVDAHFAAEAEAVRRAGGDVALLDHDTLLAGDADAAVARVPQGLGGVWYRRWMMPSETYSALAEALRRRGAELLTAPDRYRSAHELPGWYATFGDVTPASVWHPAPPAADPVPPPGELAALAARLPAGPAVVKDYVKSRKDAWDEACYVPDLADGAGVRRVVARFADLQGEYLTGGIVLRAFEPFADRGEPPAELRVWWLDGEPRLVTPHPDSPHRSGPEPELGHIAPAVRAPGCRFVTTDVALRTDGVWRVVEVGDGQVSDLPRDVDPAHLATLLVGTG
ncbi:ATP-grasp domain-containing protein [Streptomyces sp. V4I23]|uniref:ATP-grasp domain-containing protein n=1 Tax=Streptomyces sp. V4I23 TaxID=3042282 RepID=UPI0027D8A582|nr:ATP-grasp domain-containing protein [Streptomyces sp. V4I23]